jgi:hypothetical protein
VPGRSRVYSGATMQSDRYRPGNATLITCTWCGAPLGQNMMPARVAAVFCSRPCEIEANFWLFQEMCVIELTHPPEAPKDPRDTL